MIGTGIGIIRRVIEAKLQFESDALCTVEAKKERFVSFTRLFGKVLRVAIGREP